MNILQKTLHSLLLLNFLLISVPSLVCNAETPHGSLFSVDTYVNGDYHVQLYATANAQPVGDPIAEDYAEKPVWSPSGDRFIVEVTIDGNIMSQLHNGFDGTRIGHPLPARDPQWSSLGDKFTLLNPNGESWIQVYNSDGEPLSGCIIGEHAEWSSDGKRLLISGWNGRDCLQLYNSVGSMPIGDSIPGESVEWSVRLNRFFGVEWSPLGNRFLVQREVNGEECYQLYNSVNGLSLGDPMFGEYVTWSSQEDKITVRSCIGGAQPTLVYLYNAVDGQLVAGPIQGRGICCSPLGNLVAVGIKTGGKECTQLYSTVDGQPVGGIIPFSVWTIKWSPQGNRFLVEKEVNGEYHFQLYSSSAGKPLGGLMLGRSVTWLSQGDRFAVKRSVGSKGEWFVHVYNAVDGQPIGDSICGCLLEDWLEHEDTFAVRIEAGDQEHIQRYNCVDGQPMGVPITGDVWSIESSPSGDRFVVKRKSGPCYEYQLYNAANAEPLGDPICGWNFKWQPVQAKS